MSRLGKHLGLPTFNVAVLGAAQVGSYVSRHQVTTSETSQTFAFAPPDNGETPVACFVTVTRTNVTDQEGSEAAHTAFGYGVTDGTNQYCCGFMAMDASTNQQANGFWSDDAAAALWTPVTDGSPTTGLWMVVTGLTKAGLAVQYEQNDGSSATPGYAWQVDILWLTDAIIEEVEVSDTTVDLTDISDTTNIGSMSGSADMVLMIGSDRSWTSSPSRSFEAGVSIGLGAYTDDGAAQQQVAYVKSAADNDATPGQAFWIGDTGAFYYSSRFMGGLGWFSGSPHANGFTATCQDATSATCTLAYIMCRFKGGRKAHAALFQSPLATGDQTITDYSFEAGSIIGIHCRAEDSDWPRETNDDGEHGTHMFMASDDDNQFCAYHLTEHATSPTVQKTSAKSLTVISTEGGTGGATSPVPTDITASLTFNATGHTFSYSEVDANYQRYGWYLAIQV